VFRRRAVALLSVLAAAVAAGGCEAGPTASPPTSPRNLVILSIDTLRPDHLGLYGYQRPTSPTLDRLANEAVVFDQATTVHVTTAPAHATILTGRYPGSHGLVRNGMGLASGIPTLAEHLAARGWATGAFVSGWTLQRHTNLDRGFEVYDDDLGPPRAGARRDGRATTDTALGWLGDQVASNRRFFLLVHLFEPHWPYDPPDELALRFLPGRYELTTRSRPVHIDRRLRVNRLSPAEREEYVARYDGEIVVADRLAARLLDALDDLDVGHDTVVIVLSDHGETLFEREWSMDHGARPYDEQALVPLILRIPGRAGGLRITEPVSLLDVFPTVMSILDLPPPAGLQGRSLLPLVESPGAAASPRPDFITARPEPDRVSHIRAPLSAGGLVCAIRLPGIKLIEYPLASGLWHHELFDLTRDPGETTDIAVDAPESVAALHGELGRWRSSTRIDADLPIPDLDPQVEEALRELGYIEN
jgi:arylsulfatase A-like enzyme